MNYNKEEPKKYLRLKKWDYTNPGSYFITICTKDKSPHFGEIRNKIMGLSEAGCIAWKFWQLIPSHYKGIKTKCFVAMPDHVHGIIEISKTTNNRQQPKTNTGGGVTKDNNPMLYEIHLGKIIRWYKGRCTYEIRKKGIEEFKWQSLYYDHIIRTQRAERAIKKYIKNNPLNWDQDYGSTHKVHEEAIKYILN